MLQIKAEFNLRGIMRQDAHCVAHSFRWITGKTGGIAWVFVRFSGQLGIIQYCVEPCTARGIVPTNTNGAMGAVGIWPTSSNREATHPSLCVPILGEKLQGREGPVHTGRHVRGCGKSGRLFGHH